MIFSYAEHSTNLNDEISNHHKLGSDIMFKARVLLVEDVPIIQTVHLRLLKNLNCEIDLAVNGQIALMLYQKNKYDLIFLDIGLPDVSGLQICKFIREQKDEIPIVALTTNGYEIKEQCIEAGMNGFIQKPASKEMLKAILINLVSNY